MNNNFKADVQMSTAKKENALKAFIISLFFPVLYLVLLQLVPIIFSIVYSVMHSAEATTDQQAFQKKVTDIATANNTVLQLIAVIIFFLLVFIVFKIKRRNFPQRVQWNPLGKSVYAIAAVLGVALTLAVGLLNYVFLQSVFTEYSTVTDTITGGGITLTLIGAGLLAPVVEETAFRGLMMTRLQGRMAPWLVVALPVLFFAIVHVGSTWFAVMALLPLAVILGLTFLWTKSIHATILVHIINNVLSALFMLIPAFSTLNTGSTPVTNLVFSIVGLLVTIIMLSLLYRCRQKGASASPVATSN